MSARTALGCVFAAAGSLVLLTGLAGAAPGDLDPTFGNGGRALVALPPDGVSAQSSALQADNKVVMVGTNLQLPPPAPPTGAQLEDEDFFAVRLDANGAVDPSFGSNGIVRTPIDLDPGARDVARGVAIGADGSVVVIGDAWRPDYTSDVAFVRYTQAGELDSSFSADGIQTVDLGPQDIGYDAVVQPDGKIVAAATSSTYDGFEVVRLNADGSPDRSFGSAGVVRTPIGSPSLGDESLAVALDGGRIVVGGDADSGTGAGNFAVVRYLSDGRLDPSFGGGGIVVTPGPQDELIRAVRLTRGGKVLVAGYGGSSSLRLRLARYLGDGSLDTTFGGTGVVTTAIGNYAGALSLAIQPDGKAVAGGWSSGGPSFALARYNADGSLDPTFGDGGVRTYPVGTHGGGGTSVLLQHLPDGRDRLVQTGTAWEDDGGRFAAIGLQIDLAAPPPKRHCLVPRVIGQRLARARARIRARGCSVGRVRRARSRRARGIVLRQSPRAGTRKPLRARVRLVVSRGR